MSKTARTGILMLVLGLVLTTPGTKILAGDEDNLSENPGAEEVVESKPLGWGFYNGAAPAYEWGATKEEAHSGEYSAYATMASFFQDPPNTKDFLNEGLMFGNSNGYGGANAFDMVGDTEYHYAFWIKTDKAPDWNKSIRVYLQCWAGGTDNGDRVSSDRIEVMPTEEWTLYKGTLKTPADTVKGTIKFHVYGYNKPCELEATFYVDDVYLGLTPPPEGIVGKAVDSMGKLAATWGGVKGF